MMDLDTIYEFQLEAARKAAADKRVPLVMWPLDVGRVETLRRIPNLGNYLPEGWERVDPDKLGPNRSKSIAGTIDGVSKYFVDKSGWGGTDEPALTIQEMADLLKPHYGYAIVEEGQFQIGIGVFRKLTKMGKSKGDLDTPIRRGGRKKA